MKNKGVKIKTKVRAGGPPGGQGQNHNAVRL